MKVNIKILNMSAVLRSIEYLCRESSSVQFAQSLALHRYATILVGGRPASLTTAFLTSDSFHLLHPNHDGGKYQKRQNSKLISSCL